MARRQRDTIDIHVVDLQQLFDTMDPFPFRERAIDADVDEYICDHAEALAPDSAVTIAIHLPPDVAASTAAQDLPGVFAGHFARQAERETRELATLMRTGRIALVVGLIVLAVSLIAGQALVGVFPNSRLAEVVMEGLVIFGWVANWRPMEIFLFEWWPFLRKRRLYRRLAQARFLIKPFGGPPSASSA